ncbi:MAG: adenylosuccinate synthetase [Anaerolineae bacterium]|nr:adenylosuccinate synthetase [Anaerolineae bacterium]
MNPAALESIQALHRAVYVEGELFGVDRPHAVDPLQAPDGPARPNAIAVAGGAFGDEGKGRVVDELCMRSLRAGRAPLVYRWNGGANAGHTVIVNGQRVALHQLPSGALHREAVIVLGKGMVIHPGDLLAEIDRVRAVTGGPMATLIIDENAVLALDTHRALEAALRDWQTGGSGATGRGIAPAYADVVYRHPLRVRDLIAADWRDRLRRHYALYAALVKGLGRDLATVRVPSLRAESILVGPESEFIERHGPAATALDVYAQDSRPVLENVWAADGPTTPIIFEGAQAIGLDTRWGVYPDVTASDPTFDGIAHSTEGMFRSEEIAVRAGAIKATYTSSVGSRRLPTAMDEALAQRIRDDAHEYGSTTRRPRDIVYIDLPCLRFFARISGMTHLILTHLDISYPDAPIRVCTHYTDRRGHVCGYRPDQGFLSAVTPHYLDLPAWDGAALRGAQELAALPREALQYVAFLTRAIGCPPLMATTGPERTALLSWLPG